MAKCKSLGNNTIREYCLKCNIAQEGREAFMQWLISDDKKSNQQIIIIIFCFYLIVSINNASKKIDGSAFIKQDIVHDMVYRIDALTFIILW